MLRQLLHGLSQAVPSQCAVCRAWPAQAVCQACIARFGRTRERCSTCALPIASGRTRCGRCERRPPALAACFAAVDYDYPWSACIGAMKFGAQPGWAPTLAALVRQVPGAAEALDAADLAVPVPLSARRLSERGFNQALQLARALAPGRARGHVLLRVRDTPAQSTLDRAARLANLRGAFAVDPLQVAAVRGRSVALVDDVMTSGASLEEAARQLRAAGASSVTGFVVARTDEA
jgi:ComF family protein